MSTKYEWPEHVSGQEANYFGTDAIIASQTVDLCDFLIKDTLSDIETTKENIGTDFSLYLESGNFTFELTNLKEFQTEQTISDYFGFFQDDFYNSRNKFVIKVYDDNDEEVFRGILYRDGLKFIDKKKERLSVIVISLEREFKTYFGNQLMPEILGAVNLGFNLFGFRLTGFENVLTQMFPRVSRNIEYAISEYYVAYTAYTYSPASSFTLNTMHIKTGLDNFRRDETSSLQWFDSVCLGMGWIWYFHLDQLVVRQRKDTSHPLYIINYDNAFIRHDIAGRLFDLPVDTVVINDGAYHSITNNSLLRKLYGERKKIFSDKQTYNNWTFPWRFLIFNSDTNYYTFSYGVSTNVFTGFHLNNLTFQSRQSGQGSGNTGQTTQNFSYAKNQILELNPVINTSENMAGFDGNNARANTGAYYGGGNHYATGYPQTFTQVRFTGNPANCLFRYLPAVAKYETYDDYCKGVYNTDFADNFRKLVKSQLQLIFEVELNELITSPLHTFQFEGYPFHIPINGRKMIDEKHAFNLISKKTKLTLRLDAA